jgi:hypothetical protein
MSSAVPPDSVTYPSKTVSLYHNSKALVYPEHGIGPLNLMAFACKGCLLRLIALITNSVALVRERTIPTERPPPVGEVSANFCR